MLTSANYGGAVASFLTGGLSLQVEHHLFPAISFLHYPAISRIVASECAARGIPYSRYAGLPEAIAAFCRCGLRDQGKGSCKRATRGVPRLRCISLPKAIAASCRCAPGNLLRRDSSQLTVRRPKFLSWVCGGGASGCKPGEQTRGSATRMRMFSVALPTKGHSTSCMLPAMQTS